MLFRNDRWLAARGYAVASIQYRLSGEAPFPAAIHDCKEGVHWLRKHSQTFGYDPDYIGVYGGSAGAHLAALVAATGPQRGALVHSCIGARRYLLEESIESLVFLTRP